MTEKSKIGWVFYDGECTFCISLAARGRTYLQRHGLELVPLQGVEAARLPPGEDSMEEMKVLTRDGVVHGGADALVYLAGLNRWGGVVRFFACLPGVLPLLRRGYRWVAANRRCLNGQCIRQRPLKRVDWLAPALLPLLAGIITWQAAPWVMMWSMAVAIFAGCKWITLREQPAGCPLRAGAYLLLWPGMDARRFLDEITIPPRPAARSWAAAFLKMLFGIALLWGGVRSVPPVPLLQGWVGMIGIIFILHFGFFHLVALAWQTLGVQAAPLMRWPLAAGTLGEFWGARWNRGFHDLAHRHVFLPLRVRYGVTAAVLLAFLASGLVHEAVITLPAGSGFGLPTTYFLLQGVGMMAQKSRFGKAAHLAYGWRGRLFTGLLLIGPVFALFPPPFVRRVILPFLEVLHAL